MSKCRSSPLEIALNFRDQVGVSQDLLGIRYGTWKVGSRGTRVLPVHWESSELRQKRQRIRHAPALNAFLIDEAENGHAWKADGSTGCIQTEERSTVRACHYEAKNHPIIDLDHFLCIDTGVWKDGPDSGIVSLHTVEARFDSVIAVENDILGVQIEICIPAGRLSKTHESMFDSFSV
jgi:hypothetical protein